jgi:deoxyribonuclease-4
MKSQIRFGPSGIGGMTQAPAVLEQYNKLGIGAAEIPFTYQVWMNNAQAAEIGKLAKKEDVSLSIHAPYYINLASKEKKKVEASKKRILDCCERAHYLGAHYVVFHAAYYGEHEKEECYQIVKREILDMQKTIKQKKWRSQLAPEITGKASQFGDLDELLRLHKETGCFLCIDFAHLKARYAGKINYNEVFEKLKKEKTTELHCHFSGIEFTAKGERRHVITSDKNWLEILPLFKKFNFSGTIINESPMPLQDALKGKRVWEKLRS